MLSASGTPDISLAGASGGNYFDFAQATTPGSGAYSPQQMRGAYGVDGISFGASPGTGAGQAIAIVVAYDDPDIAGDLAQFDLQYGLADPPSFSKVSQTGGSIGSVTTDPAGTWEIEESIDVEWAHAMAPGASIVVVEANNNSLSNLAAATVEGAKLGSVVSMSFTTEVSGVASEFSGEPLFDANYAAAGVTYVSGTGDNGSPGGYPAYSPNVVAVGGTALNINSDDSYGSESVWGGTGGGVSQYEAEPSYQFGVQGTGKRTIPDVAADASPSTGVWIYDSYNYPSGGSWAGGWGGTSLATPLWAGLLAVADQGRAAEGDAPLGGVTQTLPALYSLPSADFHDITSGGNGGYNAGPGYDETSGLGSPVANLLVPGLAAYGDATQLAVTAGPPGAVPAGTPFGLTIAAEDAFGNLDSSYNGPVTISLANNPDGSTLSGTLTVNAVGGLATFNNLALNQPGTGYSLQTTGGGLGTATTGSFDVTAAATGPVVTPSGAASVFLIGGAPTAINSQVVVASSDPNLTGATATILSGTLQAGDTLYFTNAGGITGTYNSGTGTLTLTGTATLAQYQTALRSITLASSSSANVARSITLVVADGPITSNSAAELVQVMHGTILATASGTTNTFLIGQSAVPLDANITVGANLANLSGTSVTISTGTLQAGDTLSFSNQNGITGNYSGGVLTLTGTATPAEYQAALRSITFSTTNGNATTRSIAVVASGGSVASSAAAESIKVAFPAPVMTPSGTAADFTAGGPAVAINPGLALSSSDTTLTRATVSISQATMKSGDTLNFSNQNGISGTFSRGLLILTGTATVAQYQAALRSVTFSNPTSTSTTSRSISIVAIDGSQSSSPASETINVSAPVTISAAYISGSAWNSTFLSYLGSNSPGGSTYGFALQTGSSATQLATLPWFNLDTITVTFSGAVQDIGQGSLDLVGGSGGTAPAVSGFASLGNNTYQWTLASPLTNNRYVFAIATTGSSFGTAGSTQVVDANGAGISGKFATGQNFPSGNGLAANATSPSTFDFLFNLLPGDVNRDNNDNGTDVNLMRPLAVNTRTTSGNYNPYDDVNGDATINATDLSMIRPDAGRLATGSPTAPADTQVGGLAADVALDTATALGVIETTATSSSGVSTNATLSNVVSTGVPLGAVPTRDDENGDFAIGRDSAVSASIATTTEETNLAADQAISDFDLAEQRV